MPEPTPSAEKKTKLSAELWVAIVLAIGIGVGLLIALLTPPGGSAPMPMPGMTGHHMGDEDAGIVLSTVSVALLVALLVLYSRTYQETKAKFTLGLVFFLSALLLQTLLSSPMLFRMFGHALGMLAPFVLIAELFKVAALAIFLYLSLK